MILFVKWGEIHHMTTIDLKKIRPAHLVGLIAVGGLIILMGWLSQFVQATYIIGALAGIILSLIILPNPWYGMLLIIFFLPFERLGSYDIAGVTVRPSQITALLTMISTITYYLRQKSFPFPKNPIVWPLLLYFFVGVVGLLHAPNMQRSVMVLSFTIFTCSIALLIPFIVKKNEHFEQLNKYLFSSFLIVTVFGIYQFLGDLVGLPPALTGLRELYTKDVLGFPRVQSTALEPLYFANYLLIPLSLLISFFLAQKNVLAPWKMLGLIGIGLVNLLLTVARGGYIAFAVSFTVLIAYYFFEKKLFTPRNLIIAGLGIFIAVTVAWQAVDVSVVTDEFAGHVTNLFEGASYNERVQMFEIAQRAWQEHPWVGIGPGSFGPYENWHPEIVPPHGWRIVNNIYLETLAETGILGLLLLLSVFTIVIIRSIKALTIAKDPLHQAMLIGLLAAFFGILVQYNTFSILYIVHVWLTIGLLIALQNAVLSPSNK